jgi:hypothetical protein
MKKIVYTLSFLAISCVVANAQTQAVEIQTKPIPASEVPKTSSLEKQQEPSSKDAKSVDSKKSTGTRMAINEKGVPASKETSTATATGDKGAKPQKTTAPGQPAVVTEKK